MTNLPQQMFEGWTIFNNEPKYVEAFLIREEDIHGSTTMYQFLFKTVDNTIEFKQTFFKSRCPTMQELNLFNYFEDCQKLVTN
jgi:hypothetical protein